MPESLIFLTENSPGVSNDRFGINSKNLANILYSSVPIRPMHVISRSGRPWNPPSF